MIVAGHWFRSPTALERGFGATQLAVGKELVWHLNKKGEAWPGVPRLAQQTGLSSATVSRALGALCAGDGAPFTARRRRRNQTVYAFQFLDMTEAHVKQDHAETHIKDNQDLTLTQLRSDSDAVKICASRNLDPPVSLSTEQPKEQPKEQPTLSESGEYPPGFLEAWSDYPHYGQRSKQDAAARIWRRDRLEPLTANVRAWIVSGMQTDDWRRENGRYVPGFQAWLNGRRKDFTGPPPEQQPAAMFSDRTRRNIEAANRFIARGS